MHALSRIALAVLLATTAVVLPASASAGVARAQTPSTAADYQGFGTHKAGLFYDNSTGNGSCDAAAGGWSNMWTWDAASNGTAAGSVANIRWGTNCPWGPPSDYEKFERSSDGSWLLADGFGNDGSGVFHSIDVTSETQGDINCANNVAIPNDGGKQHYMKWTVPVGGYCLQTFGVIHVDPAAGGGTVNFYHRQQWYWEGTCTHSPYYADNTQTCVKQHEQWADDNPANVGHGTLQGLPLIQDRDNWMAKGKGQNYVHKNWLTTPTWVAYGKEYWSWS